MPTNQSSGEKCGLSPRTRGEHTIRRRGATAERSNRKVAFNRRSATRDQNILLGGLKSTAYHHDRAHLIRFPELCTTERGEPVPARSGRLCITRRRRKLCRRNNWPRRGHRQAHLTLRGSWQEL